MLVSYYIVIVALPVRDVRPSDLLSTERSDSNGNIDLLLATSNPSKLRSSPSLRGHSHGCGSKTSCYVCSPSELSALLPLSVSSSQGGGVVPRPPEHIYSPARLHTRTLHSPKPNSLNPSHHKRVFNPIRQRNIHQLNNAAPHMNPVHKKQTRLYSNAQQMIKHRKLPS